MFKSTTKKKQKKNPFWVLYFFLVFQKFLQIEPSAPVFLIDRIPRSAKRINPILAKIIRWMLVMKQMMITEE
jgi:hypothetical protein